MVQLVVATIGFNIDVDLRAQIIQALVKAQAVLSSINLIIIGKHSSGNWICSPAIYWCYFWYKT